MLARTDTLGSLDRPEQAARWTIIAQRPQSGIQAT
jgi:hypothetical protein